MLGPLPQLLREYGVEPAKLLQGCGIEPGWFNDPGCHVPYERAARVVHAAAAATGRADLGLQLGRRFDLTMLGPTAGLMQQSATVGAALKQLQRHSAAHDGGALVYLETARHEAAFGYLLYDHSLPGVPLIYDVAIMMGWRMLRTLCGPAWRPTAVLFASGRPKETAVHRRALGAPVRFDAPRTEIRFATRWLNEPIPGADAAALAAAARAVALIEGDPAGKVVERTRAALQSLLLAGRSNAERVAASVDMSERTLRRQLKQQGTSLKEMTTEVRLQLAQHYLQSTRLTLPEISDALQYADLSAFARAFKKWTGMPPARWRLSGGLARSDAASNK
jgi:AraC-like DNA-binding protein